MSSGVLLVGHGTRSDAGAAEFDRLTQTLRRQMPEQVVEGCFLELRPPTIADAWKRLVEAGVRHVHVAPLLLFSAGHAKQDIPSEVARRASTTPGISFDFARPLSRHRLLIEFAVERAEQALQELSEPPRKPPHPTPLLRCVGREGTVGAAARPYAWFAESFSASVADSSVERTALVIVGRGSYDPCAQADMRLLTELVGRRLRFPHVEVAFYAMAHPSLPEVLDRLAGSTDVQAVIVQPHVLFQGAICDSIRLQAEQASRRHPRVRFLTSPPMGPDPRVAAAIADRIKSLIQSHRSHTPVPVL